MGQDDPNLEALKEQLAAARAAREAAEQKRSKRFEVEDLQREIEREQKAAEEAEKLEEIEAEHGRHGDKIWAIHTDYGMVVVRRPTPAKFQAFIDKGKTSTAAQETFVKDFLLYPDKAQFNGLVKIVPAIIGRCADALIYLAGWRAREEAAGKSMTS